MKRSMSAVVFFTVLSALAPIASAQSAEPAQAPACEHAGRGGQFAARLHLDEHQQALMHQIFAETRPERDRIAAMDRGSPEQRAARVSLRQTTQARIDAILDDAQRAQIAQMREHRGEHRGEHGGHGHHGHHRGAARTPAGI